MSEFNRFLKSMTTEALLSNVDINRYMLISNLENIRTQCIPSPSYKNVFCNYEAFIAQINVVNAKLREIIKDIIVYATYENNISALLLKSDELQLTSHEELAILNSLELEAVYDRLDTVVDRSRRPLAEDSFDWVEEIKCFINGAVNVLSDIITDVNCKHDLIRESFNEKLISYLSNLDKMIKMDLLGIGYTLKVRYTLFMSEKCLIIKIFNNMLIRFCIKEGIGYGGDVYQRQLCISMFNNFLLSYCGDNDNYKNAASFITQFLIINSESVDSISWLYKSDVIKYVHDSLDLIKEINFATSDMKNSNKESEEITYSI